MLKNLSQRLCNKGFQRIFRNFKITVFFTRKIAKKHRLRTSQPIPVFRQLEKKRQLIYHKLAAAHQLLQIKIESLQTIKTLYPRLEKGRQSA